VGYKEINVSYLRGVDLLGIIGWDAECDELEGEGEEAGHHDVSARFFPVIPILEGVGDALEMVEADEQGYDFHEIRVDLRRLVP
jgi:hypothetical protein